MQVIKIGAKFCPGCKIMQPIWQEIEKENSWLKTKFYDADKNLEIAKKYKVKELPTFIFLDKNNQEIERIVGVTSKKEIIKKINHFQNK